MKKQSQMPKQDQITIKQQEIIDLLSIQTQFDPLNIHQEFYKIYNHRFKEVTIVRHGYKLFTIGREQQDLVRYCMALLQQSAKIPINIKFHKRNSKPHCVLYDIWLQVQALMGNMTLNQQKKQVVPKIQKNTYIYLTQKLVPKIQKFKAQKMTWEYMCSNQYTDQKVIEQFKQEIVEEIDWKFNHGLVAQN